MFLAVHYRVSQHDPSAIANFHAQTNHFRALIDAVYGAAVMVPALIDTLLNDLLLMKHISVSIGPFIAQLSVRPDHQKQ
jgi:hypothetical protein